MMPTALIARHTARSVFPSVSQRVARAYSAMAPVPRPNDVGILAMEAYVPKRYVAQEDLEAADGVGSGKYTIGLGQQAMAFVDDREDINSICLTAVNNLLEKYDIDPRDVGRLEVGTESLVDKSKSAKTTLMQLFESHGNRDLEGATVMNACYGGTASFLNSTAWVESSAWDGRYAVFVAADIAVYEPGPARPTGGVGAVACLAWDFYKPNLMSEYPSVDGQLSQSCYLRAVDDTYNKTLQHMTNFYGASADAGVEDLFKYMVFHSPYNKLVRQSFGRLLWNDFRRRVAVGLPLSPVMEPLMEFVPLTDEESLTDRNLVKALVAITDDMYATMVAPTTGLSRNIGNTYTASVFANLLSLIDEEHTTMPGNTIGMFSYGSGAIATMYGLRATDIAGADFTLARIADTVKLGARLEARQPSSPAEFTEALRIREQAYGQSDYAPVGSVAHLAPGSFYLAGVDSKHRREYARV